MTAKALLKKKERDALRKIARTKGLGGQRARALLAIDGGKTQAEAASEAGLSPGQFRYCLVRFRQHGLAAFESAASRQAKTKKTTTKADKKADKKSGKKKDKKGKKAKKGKKKKKSGK